LALKPKGLVLPSIHASLVRAFRRIGVLVEEIPASTALGAASPLALSWPKRSGLEAVLALNMGAEAGLIPTVRELQLEMAVPWIIWFLDHPEGYGFPESCHPDWSLVFCWDKALAQRLSNKGPLFVRHLPLASDPTLFHPLGSQREVLDLQGVFVGSTRHPNPFLEDAAKSCPGLLEAAQKLWNHHREHMDLPMEETAWRQAAALANPPSLGIRKDPLWGLWVKSCLHLAGRIKRVEMVEEILGARGAVFGDPSWKDLLKKVPYLGPVKYGARLRDVYLRSYFVLEVRQPQSHGGLSQRVFDASLCGRPVLAEWSPELEEVLGGPERVWAFRSLEEAVEARKLCFGSPSEALKKAYSARKEVLSRHTFLHRARFLVEHLKKEFF